MGKIAFLFPGQGAHYVGMGENIFQKSPSSHAIFKAIDALRPNTSQQCFKGPKELLNKTSNTQPCIFALELAMAASLEAIGIIPQGIAGFSLGEISGLVLSEILSPGDGLALVIARGIAMENASQEKNATMVAVLKLSASVVEKICADFSGAYPVNYNTPLQLVVAIDQDRLFDFSKSIKEAGGRCLSLGLSGGFHSPYMDSAKMALSQKINNFHYNKASLPLYRNESATPYPNTEEEIKKSILNQMNHPVLWEKTIRQMKEDGFDTFIEVGPGKTLTGFLKKIDPTLKSLHGEELIEDYYGKDLSC